ncbi:unnamed protein product, partial [marine sediment metagenome]
GTSKLISQNVEVDNYWYGTCRKIAVFFWASDIARQNMINKYVQDLENKGYRKFFLFKNTQDYQADLLKVANYVNSGDAVFFYLAGWAHTSDIGKEYLHQDIELNRFDLVITCDELKGWACPKSFRDFVDSHFDGSKVGVLVESGYSGLWVEYMKGGGYFVMSSSDKYSLSYYHHDDSKYFNGYITGLFSKGFFDAVESGSNAIDAFSIAKNVVNPTSHGKYQNPQLCDELEYVFFGTEEPPKIVIRSPIGDTIVYGKVLISAVVSSDVGIVGVLFYIDDGSSWRI